MSSLPHHRSKFHQYWHLVRLTKMLSRGYHNRHKRRHDWLLANKARFIRENQCPETRKTFGLGRARLRLSCRRRASWPTQAGSRVKFTFAGLRKMKVIRDDRNRIVDVIVAKPKRVTAKQATNTLANLLAYLDGNHNDPSAIEQARELIAA